MDNTIFDQWKKALQQFNDNMEKELEEVRKCKRQMQAMRSDLENYKTGCYYIRDDNRLILSAPEIVIGNVDMNGELWGAGGSIVTIRGNHITTEGVGDGGNSYGTITQKASIIRNVAVDAGQDGNEAAVMGVSQIVNQARNISLYSTEETEAFTTPAITTTPGVFIHSDAILDLEAATSVEGKLEIIESQLKELEETKKAQKKQVDGCKKAFEEQIDILEKLSGLVNDIDEDDLQDIRSNVADLIDKQEAQETSAEMLLDMCIKYATSMSEYAETSRQITSLKAQKEALNSRKANFKEEPTGALLSMKAEAMSIATYDGDNNLRVNPGAGINIQAPMLNVSAHDNTGKLIPDGVISMQAENIQLATNDVNYKDPEKQTDADIEGAGSIQMLSKAIVMASIDSEIKDDKAEEKGLTKDGAIIMRAENIDASAYDKEGKATGKLSLNALNMEIKAMNMKREEGKPAQNDAMAEGSQLHIIAENIIAGSTETSKLVQLGAEKVGVFAKDTAEMQQDGKAVLTLSGGNADLGGSAVNLLGNTAIKGNAEIAGETKSPKVTSDQVEAKSAFKSPNINDTMGAGVPGAAGSPSPKMKEEKPKE